MKTLYLNSRKIETLFYVFIWALVFSIPYFNERIYGQVNWNEIVKNWIHVIGYLVIFLVNVYILVPQFLLTKKYLLYFVLVSVLILLVITLNMLPELFLPAQGNFELNPVFKSGINPPMHKLPFMVIADNIIISILTLGASTTIKLMSKWLNEEKLRKDIEKEQLKTNLALLKHQVSPHFFMNTLNNIHTLIEIDTEKAQDAVERLSTLMRYLLYDSAQNTIELKKEIEFIHSFISLMQLRHSDEVEIKTMIPEHIPDTKIPPMLFITLIENAFKHGVSYPLKSFIHFELKFEKTSLNCIIKNSKNKNTAKKHGEYPGIGLDNIKNSLQLLYEDNFELIIFDKESEFEVNLKIPL
jgi:sensor histidine kinase YesM